MGHHFGHINGVAEMISGGAGFQNGIDHLDGAVAAVVIDDEERIVLNSIHDLLDIRAGEFCRKSGREQPGHGLCDDDAVRACFFVGFAIFRDELCGLFQQDVDHVRFFVAIDHDLGHVQQTCGQ